MTSIEHLRDRCATIMRCLTALILLAFVVLGYGRQLTGNSHHEVQHGRMLQQKAPVGEACGGTSTTRGGGRSCRKGACCSASGVCGLNAAACGRGCQPGFGRCEALKPKGPKAPEKTPPKQKPKRTPAAPVVTQVTSRLSTPSSVSPSTAPPPKGGPSSTPAPPPAAAASMAQVPKQAPAVLAPPPAQPAAVAPPPPPKPAAANTTMTPPVSSPPSPQAAAGDTTQGAMTFTPVAPVPAQSLGNLALAPTPAPAPAPAPTPAPAPGVAATRAAPAPCGGNDRPWIPGTPRVRVGRICPPDNTQGAGGDGAQGTGGGGAGGAGGAGGGGGAVGATPGADPALVGADPALQAGLDRINFFRARHQVPPLTWSTDAAAASQAWVNSCAWAHSSPPSTTMMENWAGGYPSLADAVEKQWYTPEVVKYNFANPPQTWSQDTSHFTQMVWKSTTQVGCAYKMDCQKGAFFVCNYLPPGNTNGQFAANVFPAQ